MDLFFLVLILFNIIQIDGSLESCRQTFGSHKYDLNQLSDLTILGTDGLFRYALTPCGLVPTNTCGKNALPFERGMTSCQERIEGTKFESPMGFLDGYGKSPNLQFSENPLGPGTGIVMNMRNAFCNGGPRLVKVTFICDKNIKKPTTMSISEKPTCQFTITIKAAEACPLTKDLTGGAIFIIILFVLIIVYAVSGVLYNRFKHKESGLALLPHVSFWLHLGGLTLNGCKFTWNCIHSCSRQTSTSSTTYESV
ncbi:unnamed protein product [Rotaria magnacalcarata]|uniref:MRH domain-containing protein n=2 Tax=Rotaria magnacalcarata TaxID=392030 RepID=A0A819XVY4_9BILA|nr:unnamed protein product [Rotaria magnacalcarata]CAF4146820.1 unnamed protein product [Rotaria magnacalcarata]